MRKRLKNVRSVLRGNSGSGIVLVLVCMLCVSILGVMVMYLSYTGLLLKVTERQSKANFYDASTAMDEIRAGVQKAASDSIAVAYKEMLVHYSDAAYSSNMTARFQEAFREQMKSWQTTVNSGTVNLLSFANGANTGTYNADVLTSFVTSASATVTSTSNSSASYNAATNALVLKGVRVTYTDTKNYTTSVTSDITIGMPDFTYVISSYSVSGLPSFALIAGNTLTDGGIKAPTIDGSAYAGQITTSQTGIQPITLKNGTVISRGDISVNGTSVNDASPLRLVTENSVSLWAKRINVGANSAVNLAGSTYVLDDLDLAYRAKATLSGSYYGFGNDEKDATKSSSILVNGTGTTLDMYGLSRLMLAGHSFVWDDKNLDLGTAEIMMGESVSVRGNQMAYLAPKSALTNNGSAVTGNPLIYSSSDTLNVALKGDSELISKYGASLKTIHKNYPGANGQRIAYFFLQFDTPAHANAYFSDYFSSNSSRINDYINDYTTLTSATGTTQAAGYTIVSSKDTNGKTTYSLGTVPSAALGTGAAQMQSTFGQLTRTLFASSSITDDATTPYTYFVDTTKINSALPSGRTEFTTDGKTLGIICRGDYTIDGDIPDTVRVVIATGNVTVARDFSGLIIAGGNITLNASVSASSETSTAFGAAATINGTAYTLGDFLLHGATNTDSAGGSNSGWNLDALITYRNWKKD